MGRAQFFRQFQTVFVHIADDDGGGAVQLGIEEGYELPPEAEDDVWALSEMERRALGIHALPTSLKSAVAAMERSDLVADTFGEDTFEFFLRNKRREYRAYDAQVTDFEISQFFPRA